VNLPPLLEMRAIDKRFGDVHANRAVDLTLHAGEVLGLLGENGAGKTTLMNILFGLYAADSGNIRICGETLVIHSPADALAAGVGMVHQHFHLVPRHTVLENLMVGERGRRGMLDEAGVRARIDSIGEKYGLALDCDTLVSDLSVGEQQRVEIVKALVRGARILILDEPTSVLTPQQSEGLFEALRALVADGVGVIFISHKLQEVLAITDRLAIMRRGQMVARRDNDGSLNPRELAELMCGHELEPPSKPLVYVDRVLLQLSNIAVAGKRGRPAPLSDFSLTLHGGEIVGVAGVSGNGQRALAEVIAGLLPPDHGHIAIDDVPVDRPTPRRMQQLGVSSVPEDRIGAGLLSGAPLSDSMLLTRIGEAPFSRFGWLNFAAIRRWVLEQMQRFDIRAPGPEARTGTLSGGNLQKALLARALAFDPLVLVAAQPTRGLDTAAREFVHRQFLELRGRGRGVLMISEDLEELFAVSDRLIVMYEGRLVCDVAIADTSVAAIGLLMTGGKRAA
jgi:simple sugar transport system ATP-binding protein